ncbi:hypothetical protein Vretifemale_16105 [Volvox reticuliferus]|uniref:Uncharacterized protein n=1 Tax=Volvox reticuliferus TaxID=1737510 RepID=A0A8J4CYL5_9CHLO|nr:hypothetical protein Vretifemale_16105 [Volvox reticuliferus]
MLLFPTFLASLTCSRISFYFSSFSSATIVRRRCSRRRAATDIGFAVRPHPISWSRQRCCHRSFHSTLDLCFALAACPLLFGPSVQPPAAATAAETTTAAAATGAVTTAPNVTVSAATATATGAARPPTKILAMSGHYPLRITAVFA